MFWWLPIIGPVIDGIVSVVKNKNDTRLQSKKIDADVHITDIQEGTKQLALFKDDIVIRFFRDVTIAPWAFWSFLIGWDTIVALRYPHLKFNVAPPPEVVAYLPGAALTFLLGNLGINAWKRS